MTIESKNPSDDISKDRPQLKSNTIKQYVINLNKLKKIYDTDNYDFLKKPKDVMDKLSDLHYLSQRNILNAIVVLLRALNSDEKYDDLLEEYGKLRDELNDKYSNEQKTGVISDKQSKNFATTEEVFKMINDMDKDLQSIKKKNKDKQSNAMHNITKKEMQLLQAYTLFNIYARMPFRNDVAGMTAINQASYKKLSDDEKKENNYLVVPSKGNMYFVLNKYKTSKKYEELDLPIEDKDLRKILKYYLKMNGMGILFKTSTGKPLTRIELSKVLLKYSKKYMNKSISTTLLRKSYLSGKYSKVKDEMKKDSKILGHDVATTGMKVYVKKEKEEESSE
jgi:integrase